MKHIRRFKPVYSITFKQYIDLLIADFFHPTSKHSDFLRHNVDISDKNKPKLQDCLQLLNYKYYNL